jgi:hypothetical protein
LAASSLRCSKPLGARRPSRLSHERVLILLSLLGAARQVTLSAADVVAVR